MFTITWPWQKKREIEDDTELGLTTEQEDDMEPSATTEQDLVARIVAAGGEDLVAFVTELVGGMCKNLGYLRKMNLKLNSKLIDLLQEVGADEFAGPLVRALYRIVGDNYRMEAPEFGYNRYYDFVTSDTSIEIGCWSDG